MKKISFLILILSACLFAETSVIQAKRITEGSFYYGLPSWVELVNDANVVDMKPNGAVIRLPSTHYFKYMGSDYESLTVFPDGKMLLGEPFAGIDVNVEPHLVPFNGVDNIGNQIKWKVVNKEINGVLLDQFIVIQYEHFRHENKLFSCQIFVFLDGEIQVQLWQDDLANASMTRENWMTPSMCTGQNILIPKIENFNTVSLYNEKGLRPGWIAKGFDALPTVVTEPYGTGKGLLVQMNHSSDDGALIAYDNSRENPVLGGIASARITVDENNIMYPNNMYVWFFEEITKKNADAKYITTMTGDFSTSYTPNVFYYSVNYYNNQWGNVKLEKSPYIFRPSYAIKFQTVGSQQQSSFLIKNVVYTLRQLPCVHFLAPKAFKLNFTITGNGSVKMDYPKGQSTFSIYKGNGALGSIYGKMGAVIQTLKINDIEIIHDGKIKTAVEENINENKFIEYSSFLQTRGSGSPYSELIFEISSMTEDINVEVNFSSCKKRTLDYVVPASAKTVTYLDNQGVNSKNVSSSVSFKNSFGKVVQTQDSLRDGKYVINTTYTNGSGDIRFKPLAFVRDTTDFGYLDMYCYDCIVKANEYFSKEGDVDQPYAFNHAYYESVPKIEFGSSGQSYGIGKRSKEFHDNVGESWGFPASSKDDFIDRHYLDKKNLQMIYLSRISNPGNYHLTVNKDDEGRFSQSIQDEKGRLVSSWNFDGVYESIVYTEYDEFDRKKRVYPKGKESFETTYKYNLQNQIVEIENKDRGITRYAYDQYGRQVFSQSAEQYARGKDNVFTLSEFDAFGRIVAAGEVTSGLSFENDAGKVPPKSFKPTVRTIYGMLTIDSLTKYGIDSEHQIVAENIISQIEGVRKNDVGAVISYSKNGEMNSIKLSSYDRLGRLKKQWFISMIGDVPAAQLSYSYNLVNDLDATNFSEWNGSDWVVISERTRKYEPGTKRLLSVYENGSLMATYTYTTNGKVSSASYYDDNQLVFTKKLYRDVYNRLWKISYENKNGLVYEQTIEFENDVVSRIVESKNLWENISQLPDLKKNNNYKYDFAGRLNYVSGDQHAEYAFDAMGRMTKKVENDTIVGYDYKNDAVYRPSGMTVSGRTYTPIDYFSYDASGNVWLDRRMRAAFVLNTMGLPERIRLFKEVPVGISLDNLETFGLDTGSVSIAYDESGTRIYYNVVSDHVNYSEAIVPGVGVYTSNNSSKFEFDRENLIAGGFRKKSTAYFPVTDVQGNVRGYANKNGLVSAFDYMPYGSIINIAEDNTGSRNRWQGKEFDGEFGKMDFGSRLYDPMFAMWISPDPANQFANPYTYGGDPLNYVDPNGEIAGAIIGAAVGAAISASVAAVQCSGPTEVGCAQMMAKSAAIGAVSGLVSAGLGGAISGGVSSSVAGLGSELGKDWLVVASPIIGGSVGGAAGGAAGNFVSGLLNDASGDELLNMMWQGGVSGFLGGMINSGLDVYGEHYGGTWFYKNSYIPNPATMFARVPSLAQGISSALSSMVVSAISSEKGDYWDNVLSDVLTGMGSSMYSAAATYALINFTYKYGGGLEALNRMFSSSGGEFMIENDAFNTMKPGDVSASVNDGSLVGWFIMFLSGGGPFSHIRGVSKDDVLLETNLNGVQNYGELNESYNIAISKGDYVSAKNTSVQPGRLTFVTHKYRPSNINSINGLNFANVNGTSYIGAGLCSGSVYSINNAYKGGAPNNLWPWQYRYNFGVVDLW